MVRKRAKKHHSTSLPVVGSGPKIRPSKNGGRRAMVLIAVHLLIAAHIAHWWLTGSTISPIEPSEAMELGKHGVVNAGLVFFAAAILLTALFGRFFCGWGCHLVALQDACRWLLLKVGLRPKPLRSRALRWVPMIAFVYMFLWPAAYRLWNSDHLAIESVELTTTRFWATFPGLGIALLTFFICGFVIVYFLGAKGFCTYGCPYGAIFGVVDRLALVRIRVTDACEGCGHCTAVCSSNVRVHEEVRTFGMVTDSGCMKCMDCVSVCPNDALYLGFGMPALAAGPKPGMERPSRRRDQTMGEEVLLGLCFLFAFVTFRGLYGVVPFLLALGLSAILSFLVLQALRLVTRPNLTLRRMAFKRGGRLRPAGYGFVAVMMIIGLFWLHSAVVRYRDFYGARLVRSAHHHAAQGRPAAAAELYAEAIEVDSSLVGAYLGLGLLRVESGDLPAALGVFERGLAAGSDSAELLYNAGLVRAMGGDAERAIARFEQALAIDSRHLPARENLAGVLCSIGRFRDGLGHYRLAIEISPDDPETHVLMARAHLALGEVARAEERLVQAIEIDPDVAQASAMLEDIRGGRR